MVPSSSNCMDRPAGGSVLYDTQTTAVEMVLQLYNSQSFWEASLFGNPFVWHDLVQGSRPYTYDKHRSNAYPAHRVGTMASHERVTLWSSHRWFQQCFNSHNPIWLDSVKTQQMQKINNKSKAIANAKRKE